MRDSIAGLVKQEGWHSEGTAARVHYDGGGDRYAIEFYADADVVVYWTVPRESESATPVPRETIPTPLRRRIRDDLAAAGVDPDVERQPV